MTSFVLVHGSGQNASCWSRVGDVLAARGHAVATPELPKQAPDWRLEDYATCIAESMRGTSAVVVAHSLSGALLPLLPGMRDCALLVYLAAVIPEPGRSVREQFAADSAMFSPDWIAAGPRWFDASQSRALAEEFLFHDCDPPTLNWALASVDPLVPGNLVTQACPLTRWPEVAAASVVASQDRTLSPDWCRRVSRRRLNVEPIDVDAGHCPHVSRPVEIATLFERLATDAGA
jgi:pimeloyl-ACP methyl ester carboxylesterase